MNAVFDHIKLLMQPVQWEIMKTPSDILHQIARF